uniref:Cellulose synthase A catalytic subunit 2 UDP-forming-like n=1 Tax=Rhizophora mucronata TaxID=61149 RepID=A0A2P2JA61_RHIMU
MVSHLLLAMNVHSLCVDLAMSTKEERVIKPALSAKPDTSASKGVQELKGMKKRTIQMIWRMSLILGLMTEEILIILPGLCSLLALTMVLVPSLMLLVLLLHLS